MTDLRKKCITVFLLISIFMLFIASGCTKQGVEPLSKTEIVLDTACQITVYDKTSEQVLDKAFDKLNHIQQEMSAQLDSSEISKVAKAAGKDYVKVSDETFYVIKEGLKYGDLTGGKFDITIGPLINLWGITSDHPRVPSPQEIKDKLSLVNYKNVLLDEANKKVMLKNKGMSLDLGGIAKGYAGDAVVSVLRENGIKHAIVNLGGNVITMGTKPDGSDWKVGIQDPSLERGNYLGIVHISNKAVVTSGIYERYFEQDGKRYHHILDTSTGYPVDNSLASVTIVTDKSIDGDGLAKAFCLGLEGGLKFIEGIKGAEAIFVTKDSEVYITPGLRDKFEITDENFKLMN